MNWIFRGKEYVALAEFEHEFDFPLHGFVYQINYTDGTKYIGMKTFKSKTTLAALADGTIREGAIRIGKNVKRREDGSIIHTKADKSLNKSMKATREYFDVVYKESRWQKYEGSCKDATLNTTEIESKEILMLAQSKRHLSYLENYYLYSLGCIEPGSIYRNSNIGGLYYKGSLI